MTKEIFVDHSRVVKKGEVVDGKTWATAYPSDEWLNAKEETNLAVAGYSVHIYVRGGPNTTFTAEGWTTDPIDNLTIEGVSDAVI